MKGMPRILLVAMMMICGIAGMKAQNVALKTNLLYDATATANLGVEVGLAPKWTLDVSGNLNAWTVKEHYWKHWLAQPEARYWFCERFQGHFIGLHALGGQFNFGNISGLPDFLGTHLSQLKDHRFQGWGVGAGVAYGYAWALAKHWNLEAEIGLGWIYTRYDVYPCTTCGTKQHSGKSHNYVGPTKAAVNLVYVF